MSINDTIARLERELEEAKESKAQGFSCYHSVGDNYRFFDDHVVIEDEDGCTAGIILNESIVRKYLESLK
jgi:hypothetical protein